MFAIVINNRNWDSNYVTIAGVTTDSDKAEVVKTKLESLVTFVKEYRGNNLSHHYTDQYYKALLQSIKANTIKPNNNLKELNRIYKENKTEQNLKLLNEENRKHQANMDALNVQIQKEFEDKKEYFKKNKKEYIKFLEKEFPFPEELEEVKDFFKSISEMYGDIDIYIEETKVF